ncbi:MAG: hypothetical protein ACTSQI_16670 [Candidatus Helarchaeota archaeon]
MGWIRKILWITGGLILLITFLSMVSQVYWEGLGWDAINLKTFIFWYVFGTLFIVSMFVYDLLSFLSLRSNVHRLMDETEQITPEEIAKILEEPLWRVRPIFRSRKDADILIVQSGKYMHFNRTFQEKFIEQYKQGLSVGELALQFGVSKTEINLIIDELDYKGLLPEVEKKVQHLEREHSTKGLRKTVRLRKKYKKKHR